MAVQGAGGKEEAEEDQRASEHIRLHKAGEAGVTPGHERRFRYGYVQIEEDAVHIRRIP